MGEMANREIKFRFWNKHENKMEYTTGYIFSSRGFQYDFAIPLQFTGLHDKNGLEIYEGDILAVTHQKYLSVGDERFYRNGYKNRVVQWRVTSHHNGWNIYNAPQTQFEVIGNIYENKELLKD